MSDQRDGVHRDPHGAAMSSRSASHDAHDRSHDDHPHDHEHHDHPHQDGHAHSVSSQKVGERGELGGGTPPPNHPPPRSIEKIPHGDHDHDDHTPGHDDHDHHGHAHGDHDGHAHGGGLSGLFDALFHSHSHEQRTDRALENDERGIRALKISLGGLLVTALFQLVIVVLSGSVALLADTVHNFADALTAVPLWIAFVVGRRPPNRRYTYGYRRAEDLAGIFIVLVMVASAAFAGYESYRKLIHPEPLRHLGWVMAASVIGFLGNELVAVFRIRVGRQIGSAALEADGYHARTDGLTSLAVLIGAVGVWLGFPQADPIVGMLITIPILLVVRDAARTVWERLMDAVDPRLVEQIEARARKVEQIQAVRNVRVRWLGHNLEAELQIDVDSELSTGESHTIAQEVEHALLHALPQLETVTVHVNPISASGEDFHALTAHHRQPAGT